MKKSEPEFEIKPKINESFQDQNSPFSLEEYKTQLNECKKFKKKKN